MTDSFRIELKGKDFEVVPLGRLAEEVRANLAAATQETVGQNVPGSVIRDDVSLVGKVLANALRFA